MVREITPQFMPLNTPEVLSGGRLRQSPDAGALKPLSASDFIPGAKVKDVSEHDQLTEQAQKWVGQTFYGTLLKQMHDSPFKASWVDGGRGGQAFQPLLDQKIVDHLSRRSTSKSLVRSMVRKLERKRAYEKQSKSSSDVNRASIERNDTERLPMTPTAPTAPITRHHVAPGLRA
jgi:peptidoglycan hydrolase FlgJ